MAVKNSVFRDNWVDRKMAGMKTIFFTIFDPTWTHILVPPCPNKEFIKEYFSQERQKLYYYQFWLQDCEHKYFCITIFAFITAPVFKLLKEEKKKREENKD